MNPTVPEPQYLDKDKELDTDKRNISERKEMATVEKDVVKEFMEGVADEVEVFIGKMIHDVRQFKEELNSDVENFFRNLEETRALQQPPVTLSFDTLEERIIHKVKQELRSEMSSILKKAETKSIEYF